METIHNLSKKYGFKIIEDASHAIGATYEKIKVGSCVHSDITVFSFHPVKIITTGEGGIALTKSKTIAEKLEKYRSHGIHSSQKKMRKRKLLLPILSSPCSVATADISRPRWPRRQCKIFQLRGIFFQLNMCNFVHMCYFTHSV